MSPNDMILCAWALNNIRGAAEKKIFDIAGNHEKFAPYDGREAIDVEAVPVSEKIAALEEILDETDGSAFSKADIRAAIAKLRG